LVDDRFGIKQLNIGLCPLYNYLFKSQAEFFAFYTSWMTLWL